MRIFSPEKAKRLDMHWNSKAHKEQEELAQHLVQNYSTGKKEKKHQSIASFKKSMGLFQDTFKSNFAKAQHKI